MRRLGESKAKNKKPHKPNKKQKVVTHEYRIIITNKGKSVKTLKISKDRNSTIGLFEKELTINRNVVFPVKYNVFSDVVESEYELLFVRRLNNDDHDLQQRQIFDNKFKIIRRETFLMEETFQVFGFDPVSERMTVNDLKKHLLNKTQHIREYGILQNKIIIFNDDCFDMIVCKCPEDGIRLGKFLYVMLNSPKQFFYRGEYYGGEKPEIVDIICEFTGWSRKKVHRNRKNS